MNKTYIIGMLRKSDGTIYLAHTSSTTSFNGMSSSGVKANFQYTDYFTALDEIKRLASIRSEDYEYVVLELVASAKIASKPVTVTEYK